MKTLKLIILLAVASIFTFSSCSKEPGFEGKNTIKGSVTLNGAPVKNAIVYLAFDTKEVTSTFHASTATDANGNYSFSAVSKGDYYMEAEYTNPMQITFKSGGAKLTIGSKKDDVVVDLILK
jgi:hypothetical protein